MVEERSHLCKILCNVVSTSCQPLLSEYNHLGLAEVSMCEYRAALMGFHAKIHRQDSQMKHPWSDLKKKVLG